MSFIHISTHLSPVLHILYSLIFVRVPGIEPESVPWQATVLPLNHTRFPEDYTGAYELGNYCARRDSNPQPLRPKRNALSLELRAQTLRLLFKSNMVEQQILQKLHFS